MRAFDGQLLRLKQSLGLLEDQEVAAALGMNKAALADRKKRGAFPVDKLKALAMDKPELQLNVQYILTGIHDEHERRLDAVRVATKIAAMGGDNRAEIQHEIYTALVESLSVDERRLLHCFRRASAKGKAALLASGEALGGDEEN